MFDITDSPEGTVRFVTQRQDQGETGSTCEFVVFFLGMELSLSSSPSPSPSLSLSFSLSQLCVYFFFTSPSLVSYQIFPNIFSHFYSLFLLLVVGLPPLLLPSDDPRRSVWCCRWLGSFVGIQDNLC